MTGQELLALRAADGASVTLERFPIVVGRVTPGGPTPDVDLSHLDPNDSVDSRHCELMPHEDGVEVHDLGGVSGTWVDGRRLAPGGRAVLQLGSALRVAGVVLTLVPSPARRTVPQSPPAFEDWAAEPHPGSAPPPPSAGAEPIPEIEPRRTRGLDLSGAPPLLRSELERGATSARLTEGFPLAILRGGQWTGAGSPIGEGQAGDALQSVRRALEMGDGSRAGSGWVGDLVLDFVGPPISERIHVRATVAERPPLPESVATQVADHLAGGGTVLVATRPADLGIVEVARQLEARATRARVMAPQGLGPRLPEGWPVLRPGSPEALREALVADPLLLVDPEPSVLEDVARALPRTAGGTLVALSSASGQAALEQLATALGEPATSGGARAVDRAAALRLVDTVLALGPSGWTLGRPGLDSATGGWSTHPAGGEGWH